MANEISLAYTSGVNLYAVIRTTTGSYLVAAAPEAFDAAHWSTYALALTQVGTSGQFFADFPAAAAGDYLVDVYLRAGGSPAASDGPPIASGAIGWTGTAPATNVNVTRLLGSTATVTTTAAIAAAVKTDTGNNSTAGSMGKQMADSYNALTKFAGLQITGVVAASPSPTTTAFTMTLPLDEPLPAGKTASGIAGQFATLRNGSAKTEGKPIASCVINSTTSLSLTFTNPNRFSAAPAAGDPVSISE
jgi:hypothetical protein